MIFNLNNFKIEKVVDSVDKSLTDFMIVGFDNALAETLLNTIRMGLYTLVPKYSPIAMNITGIEHMLGVSQNILEGAPTLRTIVKGIKIKLSETNNPTMVMLEYQGARKGDVLLSDFKIKTLDGQVIRNLEYVNPQYKVFTSTSDIDIIFTVYMIVGYGTNYSIDKSFTADILNAKDTIELNPVFNPVTKVSIRTKSNMPVVGESTSILTVGTDGTITANMALTLATECLGKIFQKTGDVMRDLQEFETSHVMKWDSVKKGYTLEKIETTPIENLNQLDIELYNSMKNRDMNTYRDILLYSGDEREVLQVKNKIIQELMTIGLDVEQYR